MDQQHADFRIISAGKIIKQRKPLCKEVLGITNDIFRPSKLKNLMIMFETSKRRVTLLSLIFQVKVRLLKGCLCGVLSCDLLFIYLFTHLFIFIYVNSALLNFIM